MPPRATDYDRARRRAERMLETPPASPDALISEFVAATADVLGATSSCWHLTDPVTGLPISVAAVGDPPGSFEESLEYEFRRPDHNRFPELRARHRPAASICLQTQGKPRSSSRFREMIEPTGTADELRVVFADAFGAWAAAVIFTDREMARADLRFVSELVPAATAALRSALAADERTTAAPGHGPTDTGAPSVLILDTRDRVLAADQAARARLKLGPESLGEPVPGVISVLAAQARFGESGDPATARMRAGDGRWFTLDASTLDDGPDASVAIVVAPAPYPAVLDRVLRSVGLTAREREVAGLVVQGRSNKSIAATLSVSPWTVQDHLEAIFEKTGVRTRSEVGMFVAGALAR